MKKPKQKKILIIERHNDFRESLSELLALNDYQIINASNGYLGLEFAREYHPDLIICARRFANTSCWDVLQALRGSGSTRRIPLIFLSSKPAGDEHERMLRQSNVITMVKPVSSEQLIGVIHDLLDGRPKRMARPAA